MNIPSGSRTLFLLHSADLPSGVKAADLELADSSGRKTIMPITVGRETGSLKTQTLPARAFCFEEGIPDECGFFYVTAFELPEDVKGPESLLPATIFSQEPPVPGKEFPCVQKMAIIC